MDDPKLVFLVSQPRAGSTLLQRILSGHPEVHTASEPWIMLNPLYALKEDGVTAEYDERLAYSGRKSFLDELPNGRADYERALSKAFKTLYGKVLSGTNGSIFLDKTPRYYLILRELARVFPDAQFIILYRNPVAVLSSMLDTWVEPQWLRLSDFGKRLDLLRAPQLLVRGANHLSERTCCVRYEDFVESTQENIEAICSHIGVRCDLSIIEYGSSVNDEWRHGDPNTVYDKSRPTTSSVNKWKERCSHPQYWRLMKDYVEVLDYETLNKMGYNKKQINAILDERRPSRISPYTTFSLQRILEKPLNARSWLEIEWARQVERGRRRGIMEVIFNIIGRIFNKII